MPPYMIAQERASMDPFVAKDKSNTTPAASSSTGLTFGSSAPASDEYQIVSDSNCWGRLDNELTRYIHSAKVAGVVPSDQDLQNKARKIIYDDDDPWNQTPADNKLWLDTLKYQAGIAAQAPVERLEEVPIMPPYVVRGGLRNPRASVGGISSAQRSGSGSGSGAFTPDQAMLPATALVECDTAMDMEFDFDQIDFNDMDLAMMSDPAFVAGQDVGVGGGGLMDQFLQPQGFGFGSDPFAIDGGRKSASAEMQTQEDLNMNMDMNMNLGMSERDLNQLTGYMTGFH